MKKACHSAVEKAVFCRNNSAFCILHSAFTLIELLITIVLVGIALLALIMGFHESLKSMERQQYLLSANLLCEDLMNEIRSKQYANPQYSTNFGPEAGESNRRLYNDVDDYDNWFETPPKTIEGSNLPNCAGFTRRVIVVNVPATNFNSPPLPDYYTNDFKRITVVVSNLAWAVSNVSVVSRDY
ncbi:MAG: type II secretion system protein [Verrucomicrobiota bacterium]